MEDSDSFDDVDVDVSYNIARQFILDKTGKAFRLSSDERAKLSALSYQAKFGEYSDSKTTGVGLLDLPGHQRMKEWKALGDMSSTAAKTEFVKEVKRLCPMFLVHLEACLKETDDSGKLLPSDDSRPPSQTDGATQDDVELSIPVVHNMNEIRAALNVQTKEQFEAYAMQHYPNDPERRTALIGELQERHFHEYISFIQKQQPIQSREKEAPKSSPGVAEQILEGDWVYTDESAGQPSTSSANASSPPTSDTLATKEEQSPDSCATSPADHSPVSLVQPAKTYTREDIADFKAKFSDTNKKVFTISCGELLTIRVPTSPNLGNPCWEFATDSYDLAFGLYFEWPSADGRTNEPVSETSPSPDSNASNTPDSAEDPDQPRPSPSSRPSLVEEILPIARVDCHQYVHCGTHTCPGTGTYLFHFDNTYSLWRSKLLYLNTYTLHR